MTLRASDELGGLRVEAVEVGSAADAAGFRVGDVITEIHDDTHRASVDYKVRRGSGESTSSTFWMVIPLRPATCVAPMNTTDVIAGGGVLLILVALGVFGRRRGGSARGPLLAALCLLMPFAGASSVYFANCLLDIHQAIHAVQTAASWAAYASLLIAAGISFSFAPRQPKVSGTLSWTSATLLGAWYLLTGSIRLGVVLAALRLLVTGDVDWMSPSTPQLILDPVAGDSRSLLLSSLRTLMMAPIGEELVFRGILQPCLSRWLGPTAAIVCAAVLFSALHLRHEWGTLLVLFSGLVYGWAQHKSGRIRVPIILHAFENAIAMLFRLAR
jgi:membrane protease YdiL (CAAX protease family)